MDVSVDSAHPFEGEVVMHNKFVIFCHANIHLKHVSMKLSALKRFDCILREFSRVAPVADIEYDFLVKGLFEEGGGIGVGFMNKFGKEEEKGAEGAVGQEKHIVITSQLYLIIMSTLAAARADNFYRPKNFDPSKIVPRKSDLAQQKPFVVVEGQYVGGSKVRYQTPFHVRCEGCQNMVAKGVRFNSIKTWTGNFHTTKIYEFRMKCPQCPQRFVVRTDPQNCDYIYVSGARRIFQTKDCTDQTRIRDQEKLKKIKENPFAKLQNDYNDMVAFGGVEGTIQKLEEQQERGLEDFELNRLLRKQARVLREQEKAYFEEKREKNMIVPLLPESIEDELKADQIDFKRKPIKKEQKLTQRDKLKEKMRKMNPAFRNQLRQQIKTMNRPTTSVFLKK